MDIHSIPLCVIDENQAIWQQEWKSTLHSMRLRFRSWWPIHKNEVIFSAQAGETCHAPREAQDRRARALLPATRARQCSNAGQKAAGQKRPSPPESARPERRSAGAWGIPAPRMNRNSHWQHLPPLPRSSEHTGPSRPTVNPSPIQP